MSQPSEGRLLRLARESRDASVDEAISARVQFPTADSGLAADRALERAAFWSIVTDSLRGDRPPRSIARGLTRSRT